MSPSTAPLWLRCALIAGWCGWLASGAPAQDGAPPPAQPPAAAAEDLADLQKELETVQPLIDRGRYERAQRRLDELVAEYKEDGDTPPWPLWRPIAHIQTMRGDYPGALESLGKWIAGVAPGSARAATALLRRGDLYVTIGRLEEAAKDYQAAIAAVPYELAAHAGLGELEEIRGDRKAAEAHFRKAIEIFNARPEGLDHRGAAALIAAGRAAEGLGRTAGASEGKPVGDGRMFKQAQQAYEGAQAKDDRAFEAFLRAGRMFIQNHSDMHARSYFRDVLKHNKSHPEAQAGLAAAYEANFGTQKAAAVHAQRALDVNPHCVPALIVQARLAATAENFAEAAAHCEAALEVNPNSRRARALYAACLFALNRTEEFAKADAAYAVRHAGDAGVPHAVAEVIGNQRRFAEAAAWEKKAVTIDPYHWGAHISRGMNLLRAGDEEEGKKALAEGFRNYKYDVHAANMLMLLRKLEGFVTRETAHFHMRFEPSEEEIMGPYSAELLERAWPAQKANYGGFEPEGPILYEMFPQANDFAVRTLGLPGLGALGACFGKVVTIDSPKAQQRSDGAGGQQPAFNWAATAWHEYAHVVTLQLSKGRVPRWFTEGLSEFEEIECRPEWVRPLAGKLRGYWGADRLTPILKLNKDFIQGDIGFAYYYAGWICRFIRDTHGREGIVGMLKAYGAGKNTAQVIQDVLGWTPAQFDQELHAYLGKHIGGWRLPPWYGKEQRVQLGLAVRKSPDDPTLHLRLARAYWQARNPADAEIHAGRAMRLDDGNGEAHFILGEILEAKGRHEAAKRRWELAFERGFDDYHLRLRLAQLAEADADVPKVVAHLEKAHEYFPRARGKGSPARRLVALYAQLGRDADSLKMLEWAVGLVPEDLQGRLRLLRHYVDAGDRAKVLQYCEEVNNIDPFLFDHHLTWSKALREAKRTTEAVREGRVAVLIAEKTEDRAMTAGQHTPDLEAATGHAWAVRGLAELADGALDDAKESLGEAAERAPDHADTQALAAAIKAAEAKPADGGGDK